MVARFLLDLKMYDVVTYDVMMCDLMMSAYVCDIRRRSHPHSLYIKQPVMARNEAIRFQYIKWLHLGTVYGLVLRQAQLYLT